MEAILVRVPFDQRGGYYEFIRASVSILANLTRSIRPN